MLLWKLAFRLCVLHRDGAGKAEQYAVTHPRHAGLIRANGYRPASRAHVYTIVQDPSRAPRSSHPQGNETPVRRKPAPRHPLYCTAPTESHAMAVVITVAQQKGGTGKTTLAANIAFAPEARASSRSTVLADKPRNAGRLGT
jgi:Mrp family chromosome partitioning ATPase